MAMGETMKDGEVSSSAFGEDLNVKKVVNDIMDHNHNAAFDKIEWKDRGAKKLLAMANNMKSFDKKNL
jgi:hypothetical protein